LYSYKKDIRSAIITSMGALSSPSSLDKIASFFVNICVHVFVLLTFLVIFFFKYVSVLTSNHIDHSLQDIVQEQTTNFLQFISASDVGPAVKWDIVESAADALISESSSENQEIIENNNNLYEDSICTLLMILLGLVLLICYFNFRNIDIKLKFILMENFVIFTFVGLIEIYFFLNIAIKYVPILPNDAMSTILSRLKTLLEN
jgi:hypothetical protein